MSNQYGPRIVTSGLVLCLDAGNSKSYSGSGTTWTDLSGNNYNGTLTNGPAYNSSNGGNIVFDGTNDFISLGDTNILTGNNLQNLTVSMWLKSSTTTFDLRALTLQRASGGTNSSLFGIFYNTITISGVTTQSTGSLGFFTRNFDNSIHTSLTFNDNYHLKNRFINITCIVNGMNRFLYIDGILKNSDSNIGMQSVSNNTDTAYIGSGPAGAGTLAFNGSITSVLFYRRSLTANEVLQNYNASKGRFAL